ncbi:MAG: adenylate/guanylate cyclase domain-containing protein [Desulfobacterales bacterium]|nr:MAG: adenylate/guanylate cyclase domain-containing protein [Desulfobacterales bacterium]
MNTPKEIHRIFLIADLSGYTALTEAHGNISAAKVVSRYVEMVQEVLDKDARLAEKVGDEVLIVGTNAVSIIQMALNLCDKIENEPNFPSVHVAIHAGSVLKQDGQFFGSTLNVASRVAAYARACQILCTGAVIELITNKDNISYRQLGKVNLKNIIEPISIFEIDPAHVRTIKLKPMSPIRFAGCSLNRTPLQRTCLIITKITFFARLNVPKHLPVAQINI